MKSLGIIVFLLVVMGACASQKDIVNNTPTNQVAVKDSTEYELIVLDPPFETWYLTNYSPAKDHSNEYYHSWNIQYVSDWNYHYRLGHFPGVFENYIDYDYNVDYGIDLNRKLYYYFRYVETYLRMPILMNGMKMTT